MTLHSGALFWRFSQGESESVGVFCGLVSVMYRISRLASLPLRIKRSTSIPLIRIALLSKSANEQKPPAKKTATRDKPSTDPVISGREIINDIFRDAWKNGDTKMKVRIVTAVGFLLSAKVRVRRGLQTGEDDRFTGKKC
jgi:hypothetical protein